MQKTCITATGKHLKSCYFCYVCKGIHRGIPFFSDASDEGINEKKRLCEGVRTKASCTNWSIPQKTICLSKKLGCWSLLYIVKLRDQCCLFFFQFNLSTNSKPTQIHVLQTNNEFWPILIFDKSKWCKWSMFQRRIARLSNQDFWPIKVIQI